MCIHLGKLVGECMVEFAHIVLFYTLNIIIKLWMDMWMLLMQE